MSITFLAKNSTACPRGLVHSCRGLPRSPIGRGHRSGRHQRIVQTGNAVAFASPERPELGINDGVAAPPSAWADVPTFHLDPLSGG